MMDQRHAMISPWSQSFMFLGLTLDIAPIPTENLLNIDGIKHTKNNMVRTAKIYPSSLLMVRAPPPGISVHGVLLPFLIGVAIETPSTLERAHDVVVVWYVPGLASAETFRSGPKKKLLDIFGPWTSMRAFSVAEYQVRSMPSPVVHLADILECNFDLSSDETLPYDVFDALRSHHGIDVTGLSVSSTHWGNVYRSYALLGGRV